MRCVQGNPNRMRITVHVRACACAWRGREGATGPGGPSQVCVRVCYSPFASAFYLGSCYCATGYLLPGYHHHTPPRLPSPWGADRLGELGEADGVPVEGERGVDVLHEAVAEEPDVAAETDVLAGERADAPAGARGGLTEAEAAKRRSSSAFVVQVLVGALHDDLLLRGDGPLPATPRESNSRGRVAGVVVVALARVVHTRAGDGAVEGPDGGGRAVHDGGAGVDDGLKVGYDGPAADVGPGTGELPEAGGGVDVVVLDRARVELVVGASEVELRAGGGELEAEDTLVDCALLDSRVEEGVRVEVGDGGVCETQDAVNGVAVEAARERGHGREGLSRD